MSEVDAAKRSVFFYYLARAAAKAQKREILREQARVGIKKLRKLDTKHIHSHMEELKGHLDHISAQERHILEQQKDEEQVHKSIKKKINVLEGKLGKYLKTEKARKKRIKELHSKIEKRFKVKKDHIKRLREDLHELSEMYAKASKSGKYSKEALKTIHQRIRKLRTSLHLMH